MSLPYIRLATDDLTASTDTELTDRVVMVTGASGGLGQEVARQVARAGATVILVGRKERPLNKLYDELEKEGVPQPVVVPLEMEVATPDNYAEIADYIQNEFGRLDGIVHAAAHFDALTPIRYHAPDDWLRCLQVNLSAPFALTQACLPLLTDCEDSAVVFITDDPDEVASAHWGGYGVAKAGIERFACILHDEHDATNMRVHLLLPAPMRTSLRRKAWFGEDTMAIPKADETATVVVKMLSAQGQKWRGKTLDLR